MTDLDYSKMSKWELKFHLTNIQGELMAYEYRSNVTIYKVHDHIICDYFYNFESAYKRFLSIALDLAQIPNIEFIRFEKLQMTVADALECCSEFKQQYKGEQDAKH